MKNIQVIEKASTHLTAIDLESKLLQNYTIFITGPITDESVTTYQAELIYLISQITNPEKQHISIYINSPGGSVYSCLGLYDTIQYYIKRNYIIETKVIGLAASAAAIILLSGSKGHRYATFNSTILLHQPSSFTSGTVTDMKIDLQETERVKFILNEIIKTHASEQLIPFLERDKWFSSTDAKIFNIIDIIL